MPISGTLLLVLLLLGPVLGSFGALLARRLPLGRPVALARSACEQCGQVLAARDMVPLASFVWLRGRCRTCGSRIDRQHLAFELAGLAVPLIALAADPADGPWLLAACLLGWTLLPLAAIDWQHMLLPDVLTLPLVLLGLSATAWLDPAALADHAVAATLGFAAFATLAALFRRLRGYDGLGMGDAKLLAAAGAWLGTAGLAPVMLGGALLGLALAAARRARGHPVDARTRLPFGPCLAGALWLVWLHGTP